MTTKAKVQHALNISGYPDVNIERGEGYWYFWGGIAEKFEESGMYGFAYLSSVTTESVLDDFINKCRQVPE